MIPLLAAALILVAGATSSAQTAATIAAIRVHGNHTTPADVILGLSGLAEGEPASEARLQDAERRLQESGRFTRVEIRPRYASLEDPSAILVMIVVDEHEAVSDDDLTPGPLDRLRAASMWLPIVSHADGYGFTYGARVSVVGVLGDRSRASVPMTWGGERRVALEVERSFSGPFPVLRASVALRRGVNPHFERVDRRQEARIEAERLLAPWLRIGADARLAQVGFGDEPDARHAAAGFHVTVDTRLNPAFPRTALHVRVGWERLQWSRGPVDARVPGDAAARWMADVRGYIGLPGSPVLALRGQISTSSAPLPFAEQVLIGGSESLRGYRAGHRAGDNAAAVSMELRVPLTSPLSGSRVGIKAFADSAAAWRSGDRLRAQPFERGAGGGIYFGVAAVGADVDVAWPEAGKPRVHFGLGVSF